MEKMGGGFVRSQICWTIEQGYAVTVISKNFQSLMFVKKSIY